MTDWYWQSDDGSWQPFSDDDNQILELEYHSRGSDTAVLTRNGTMYDVDLVEMKQTNLSTGFVRRVCRGWPSPSHFINNNNAIQEGHQEDDDELDREEDSFHDDDDDDDDGNENDDDEEVDDDDDGDDDGDDDNDDENLSLQKEENKSNNNEKDKYGCEYSEIDESAPSSFRCPLTLSVMIDPVITCAGSTYERSAIERWLRKKTTDPLTNEEIGGGVSRVKRRGRGRGKNATQLSSGAVLIPNRTLKDAIELWKKQYVEDKLVTDNKTSPISRGGSLSDGNNDNENNGRKRPLFGQDVISVGGEQEKDRHHCPADLREGEEILIPSCSSVSTSHTIRLLRGVYSCSCPSWRYAGGPIIARTCKHLMMFRGEKAEDRRVALGWSCAGDGITFTHGRKRQMLEPSPLQGKTVCFTGCLSIVRRVAESHALSAGAIAVTKSVTQATDIVVAGPGAGMKLTDAKADGKDIWDEKQFMDAIQGVVSNSESNTGSSSTTRRNTTAHTRRNYAGAVTATTNGLIPSRIMLAEKWRGEDKDDPTGMLMSEKLDGMRAWWDGESSLWSRGGKMIHAPSWFISYLPVGFALDGELWCGRGKFQECMSICRRQDGSSNDGWKKITYVVFDAPGLPSDKGYEERYQIAKDKIHAEADLVGLSSSSSTSSSSSLSSTEIASLSPASSSSAPVKMHPYVICKSASHLHEQLNAVEELSGEGLMLRRKNSKYTGGRSKDLLKVKTTSDDEGVVLSHETGRGRHVGRVGALHLRNRAGKRFKVGSGLTDEDRENPPPIGTVVTYRYTELTANGIPRHPVFVRVRPDVDADDILTMKGEV